MPMRLLAAALALALCAAAPARAQAPDTTAEARVATTSTGVRVRYRLPAPVSRVAFADESVVRETWTVATPGLTLADGVVSGDAPFDVFELVLTPDTQERDRIYNGLSPVGDGYVVYGPGLKLRDQPTTLVFAPATGQTGLPAATPEDGYAYIGAADQVTTLENASIVVGAGVPDELATLLRGGFSDAMRFYGARLDRDLSFQPALLVSTDGVGPALFRGDVTDTGVISLRFHGDWRSETDQVTSFVWHETFHLWNGHGVQAIDAETAPWLHEGGADYAALVGAVSNGAMSEDQVRARLARRLNGCRTALGGRAFDPASLRSGSAPYACGVLVQWLADLELRKAGQGDVFTLWRDLLGGADGYDVAGFRALLVPDSAVAVLFDGPGEDRWTGIEQRLSALGVTLVNRPGNQDLMAAALFHVAERNCKTGSFGFFNDPGALKLDGEDCGVLSGGPVIATVEGVNPQADGRALFDAVQARCPEGLPVRYLTADGRTLEAVCDAPLSEPSVWAIADSPPLALPSA